MAVAIKTQRGGSSITSILGVATHHYQGVHSGWYTGPAFQIETGKAKSALFSARVNNYDAGTNSLQVTIEGNATNSGPTAAGWVVLDNSTYPLPPGVSKLEKKINIPTNSFKYFQIRYTGKTHENSQTLVVLDRKMAL